MIACNCSRDSGDNEMPSVYTESTRRAAKQHECCECGDPIKVGERYEEAAGLWDGRWARYRTCAVCARIRSDYQPDGYAFGYLAEDIMDCLGFDYRTVPDAKEAFGRECGAA